MSVVRVEDISHVRFAAPDFGKMRRFLEDFGLTCFEDADRLYGRASDGSPFVHVTEVGEGGFRGLGLRVAGLSELHALAASEGARVEPFDTPGGGYAVRLRDPDGNLVEAVAEQTRTEPMPLATAVRMNSAEHQRRLRAPLRLTPGPSHVRRLGHAVLNVGDFRVSEAWYKERFGFITSDEVEAAPNLAMGAFLRCDRGDRPTDHHTLFLAQLPSKRAFNHAAFEVEGVDDLMLGHNWLEQRSWKPAWGIGRHKLGSQIFDYWKDPWGHELEHWTDGDLFTAADRPNKATVGDLLAVQWGAPFPALAGKRAPSPETMSTLIAWSIRLKRRFGRKQGAPA